MTTGEKIKVLRIKNGLTQQELADICGIQRKTLYKYEADLVSPRIRTVVKLAEVLGCKLEYLNDAAEEEIEIEEYDSEEVFQIVMKFLKQVPPEDATLFISRILSEYSGVFHQSTEEASHSEDPGLRRPAKARRKNHSKKAEP